MLKTLDDVLSSLPARERRAVERGAEKLLEEARTLAELRRDLRVTQASLAKALATSQANVANTERRSDLKLSTVQKVVEALGGRLVVAADLPGRGLVPLSLGGERPRETGTERQVPKPISKRTRSAGPQTQRKRASLG